MQRKRSCKKDPKTQKKKEGGKLGFHAATFILAKVAILY
jgi:hypothetical protein